MKTTKEEEDVVSGTFRWEIENFSQLKDDKLYSDVFVVGGSKWRMLIRLKRNDVHLVTRFSMYLGIADASTLPPGWTRFAKFSLTVVNQIDTSKSITKTTKGTQKEFKEKKSEQGFISFMPLNELYDLSAGYLLNDVCIVEAKVDVPTDQVTNISATMESIRKEHRGKEPSHVNFLEATDSCSAAPRTPCSQLVPPFQDTPDSEQVFIKHTVSFLLDPLVKELGEVPTSPTGKLVEFRGLGQIEKSFVPLLEEVCSMHPSLIECLPKRNRKATECALTALGGLLHFLKYTKVKDMTVDACARLQSLWDDLQIFRFDFAWLEPHVQSALDKKKLLEKARRVKRLREDVVVLDNERKRRSASLAVTERDLEVAKRDLAREEEAFVKIDMDSELGYGMH